MISKPKRRDFPWFLGLLASEFVGYKVGESLSLYPSGFQDYDSERENPIVAFYRIVHDKYKFPAEGFIASG